MNKEVERLWLEKLRSGEYEQGTACLRSSDNKFCCLGVLSDLYLKEHGGKWDLQGESYKIVTKNEPAGNEKDLLIQEVWEWVGLDSSDIMVNYGTDYKYLSELNDEGGNFRTDCQCN